MSSRLEHCLSALGYIVIPSPNDSNQSDSGMHLLTGELASSQLIWLGRNRAPEDRVARSA